MPKGMVKVGVDNKRGTETKGKGEGVEELAVREELRLMLMGPEPVASSAPAPAKPKGPVAPKRTAPRVMDDLF